MPEPKTTEDLLADLPPEDREWALARAAKDIARHYALADLRKIHRKSQVEIAAKLGVDQSAVSKLERKADLYVGTLRRYVEAAGGKLEIRAKFPGKPAVKVGGFGELGIDAPEAEPKAASSA